jgi:acyl dehydratase
MLDQGRTVATLGGVAARGLGQRLGLVKGGATPVVPGPEHLEVVPPRSPELVRDYVRLMGGDPASYRGELPPHFFHQWFFTVGERTIRSLPYPVFKMVNGGCRMEVHGRLPASAPLRIASRLAGVDDDGRRVLLHQRVATGTSDEPELVTADIYTVIPLGGGRDEPGRKKAKEPRERPRVPAAARELAFWKIPADAGLAFASLTGDFNPVHWVPAYARLFGHRGVIAHGFATFARAIEGLNRTLFAGDVHRLATFDARFTRPLVLPARVGLYLDGDQVFVGDAPSGPAYLAATFTTTAPGDGGRATDGEARR